MGQKDRKKTYEISQCHDCNVMEGEIHKDGCDMERCPFCGGQLISCSCIYEIHYGDVYQPSKWVADNAHPTGHFVRHPTNGLPQEVYENGPPDDVCEAFEKALQEKGRVPYIAFPIVCAYCGVLWPDLFMVPDEEWKKYIPISERDKVICKTCFGHIKVLIDTK